MSNTATTRRPFLTRGEFGFVVTDGETVSIPVDSFEEGKVVLRIASTDGLEAALEYQYGPADYEEYVDEDRAYAEYRERLAERGTWFGRDDDFYY